MNTDRRSPDRLKAALQASTGNEPPKVEIASLGRTGRLQGTGEAREHISPLSRPCAASFPLSLRIFSRVARPRFV